MLAARSDFDFNWFLLYLFASLAVSEIQNTASVHFIFDYSLFAASFYHNSYANRFIKNDLPTGVHFYGVKIKITYLISPEERLLADSVKSI